MGIELKNFKMTNSHYQSGVAIDEYNGTISLQSARQNDKGVWADWAFPQRFDNGEKFPAEKAVPVQVRIGGNTQEAIQTLEFFLNLLKNGPTNSEPTPKQSGFNVTDQTGHGGPPSYDGPEDDIPF